MRVQDIDIGHGSFIVIEIDLGLIAAFTARLDYQGKR